MDKIIISKVLTLVLITAMMLTSCKSTTQPSQETTGTQETQTTPTIETPQKPANFQVSDLVITPAEAEVNSPITIKVTVSNIGESSGSYDVNLKINDTIEGTVTITLAGGASQKVTFTKSESNAKTYTVKVDNQSGTFVVKLPPTPPTTTTVPSTTIVAPPTFPPISVPPVPATQTFSAQEQAAVNGVIAQFNNSFTSFLACLNESMPKNPGSEALYAAKIAVLEDPELYNKIVNGKFFLVDTAPSVSGKPIALVAVYPNPALREEAWYTLQVAKLSLPLLEEFMGTPFPSTVITVHYGFMVGSSGGGGSLIMEDKTTYMGRWMPLMMPYDPIICHELSHAYIGNEGLNQFLEIFVYNRLLGRTPAFGDWVFVRDYKTWKGTKTGYAAMLDIYQLIGLGAIQGAYRTVYQLKPLYGQMLPENCKQAFVDQAPEALKAQVRAIVANITY
jgi:hypothetical protein